MKCRKRSDVIETGVQSLPRDESGGCLLTGQVVSGVKVARARFRLRHGTWEPVAPSGTGRRVGADRSRGSTPSSGNCEGLSTDAGHRGGPSRSSGEAR